MSTKLKMPRCCTKILQRFDVNGEGVLDKAEQLVGRRIIAEKFLEDHADELHLYDQGLTHKVSEKAKTKTKESVS